MTIQAPIFTRLSTLTDLIGLDTIEHETAPFFAAVSPVATYESDREATGCFDCALYPAWLPTAGDQTMGWYEDARWCAAEGYSASGRRTRTLTLAEGIELLGEHGRLGAVFGEQLDPEAEAEKGRVKEALGIVVPDGGQPPTVTLFSRATGESTTQAL